MKYTKIPYSYDWDDIVTRMEEEEDFGDAGSLGDRKFSIFKWNDEKKRYNLLAEML